MNLNSSKGVYKRNADSKVGVSFSSGGRTRTYDLWVMSPTSYHCSTPRCYLRVQSYDLFLKHANYLAKKIKKNMFDSIILQIFIDESSNGEEI